MGSVRDYLNRFYLSTNRMDGLYYLAARQLGVNENMFALLYTLDNGPPQSQKQLSLELVIPKTTVNTVVKEGIQAGYFRSVPAGHGRERAIALTDRGRAYARSVLQPVYDAEEEAMERTLEHFSPDFLQAVEALTGQLDESFRRHILSQKEP